MQKPNVDSEKVKNAARRGMWLFMALLFVITGLGVGIYAFWQGTHQDNSSNNTANSQSQTANEQTKAPTCSSDPALTFNTSSSGKLAGKQLADYTPLKSIAQLSCVDVKVGDSGQAAVSSSTVVANYTGAVAATGKIFQSSLDNSGQPAPSFALSQVIPGWQKEILGMRAGGERRLLIPSADGYGPQGSCQTVDPKNSNKCDVYAIPPNADLVFDVSMIAVQ